MQSLRWATSAELFWLSLLFVLCCLPGLLFIGGHRLRIPVMAMWGAGYFMLFGMPFFRTGGEGEALSSMAPALVLAALQVVVLGAGFCLTFFYTPLGYWVERLTPSLRAPWDLKRAPQSGVLLCLIGLATHYLFLTSSSTSLLKQLFFVLSQSSKLGMLTLFLLQLRGQLSGRLKIFLWGGIFPAEYLLGLGTGAVFNAVVVLAPFLLCYTAERRKFPFVSAALLLGVLVIPFLGFKAEYRSYAWGGPETNVALVTASPIRKGLFFIDLVIRRLTEGGVESYTVAVETAQERASHTELLAMVMDMTPEQVPFWKGETYATLFWILVPRVFYPDKPRKTIGHEFGHRYGILGEEDEWTSVNLPHQVVEMYVNFGTLGVAIGMALIGCLYRVIAAFLGRPESGERGLLIGCTICTILLSLDSDFSLVFGGVFYCLVVLYLVSYIFHGSAPVPRKTPAPSS